MGGMNQSVADPETQTTERVETLTALDRCDSCGAQAYVSVKFAAGELLFCGHHATKYEEKMAETFLDMVDERWRLTGERLDVSPM